MSWEGISDGFKVVIAVLLCGSAKIADELLTGITVDLHGLSMAGTLHGGLFFEGDKVGGSGSHILHTHYLVAGKNCQPIVHVDAGMAEKRGALLAVASGPQTSMDSITANILHCHT